MAAHKETLETLEALEARTQSIYLIGNFHRHGALTFLTRLEYEQYPPETPANDNFMVFHANYNRASYYIVELPARDYANAETLANALNLKFVSGKPHAPGAEHFRLKCSGDACFTLEYNQHQPDDPAKLQAEFAAVYRYTRTRATS